MTTPKELAIQLAQNELVNAVDNLTRARMQFRGMKDLTQKYGQSDQTCGEILAGYELHCEGVKACLRWLESCDAAGGK